MTINDRVRVTEQVGGTLNGELVMVPAGTEGVIVETDPIVVVVDTPRGEFDMTRIPDLVPQQIERI